MHDEKIEAGVRLILQGLDCDLRDRNFQETPERFVKAMHQMFRPNEKGWVTFDETYTDQIVLRHHELFTLCPHHLLTVRFDVCIGYIPKGRVIGLSKLARVLHEVNRGPILQEAFTRDALDLLLNLTGADSGACVVEGQHGCMQARGIRTRGDVVTECWAGSFKEPQQQQRFYQTIGRRA